MATPAAACSPHTIRCNAPIRWCTGRSGIQLSFPYLARRNGVFVLLDPSLADRVGRMSQILAGDARRRIPARLLLPHEEPDAARRPKHCGSPSIDYPADDSLRQEFLRDLVSASWPRTRLPPEIAEVADDLNAPAAHVLAAARHAVQIGMARSRASRTPRSPKFPGPDAWYPEASELRVNWRTRVTRPHATGSDSADEAISMIDRARHHESDAEALRPARSCGFRRRAARGGGGIGVELCAAGGGHGARPASSTPESLRKDASALRNVLDDAAKLPEADAARIAEVRAEIAALTSSPGSS